MSRETTPTKPWADQLEQPRTSPNDSTTTPKISAGWKRQLLLHAERSKKQAEKEVEKKKKIEEWRSEEKKKVLDAKVTASPDKAATPSPVHSPFHSEQRGRGTSPTARTNNEHYRPPRSDTQLRTGNARQEQHGAHKQHEHNTHQHSNRSPSDKYAPSHRPEVESERWSRGGHVSGHRGRGSRGRGEWRSTRRSPARDSDEQVDVVSRDTRTETSTRASTSTEHGQSVVLVVNVELENGTQRQLLIHERDDLTRVARDFCNDHTIDSQLTELFVEEIATHLKQVSL